MCGVVSMHFSLILDKMGFCNVTMHHTLTLRYKLNYVVQCHAAGYAAKSHSLTMNLGQHCHVHYSHT